MRLSIIILLVTFGHLQSVAAQNSPQLLFDEANEALEQGDYRSALKSYYEIEKSGHETGALYLNMAIAAVQVDSLGLAKYYFKKAEKFSDVAPNAHEALEYVNSQFSRQSAMLPKLPWDKAVDILKVTPGTFTIFIIGFIFLVATLLLIISRWFNILIFPKHTNIVITIGLLSVLTIALSFYVDYVDERYSEAVLIIRQADVMERANPEASLISKAYEGYEVTVDFKKSESNTEWYYIRLGNGQYGWIKKEGVKII